MPTVIKKLQVYSLRNLQLVSIEPSSGFNFFIGPNGSGKTSILESIYTLGMARSFRTHLVQRVINNQSAKFTVHGVVQQHTSTLFNVGIERCLTGESVLQFNGERVKSIATLAEQLPIQLINPDSFRFLDAGPKYRRQFLDWGMFHVEHLFYQTWQRLQRILKQRNSALKNRQRREEVQAWDVELIEVVDALTIQRRSFFEKLAPYFYRLLKELNLNKDIILSYWPGWEESQSFGDALLACYFKDIHLGYTSIGPQRADLKCMVGDVPAEAILSRGQQKIVVIALCLAMGELFRAETGKSCIYLIDDLPSELDLGYQQFVLERLSRLDSQMFITCLEETIVKLGGDRDKKMFHVEHGVVKPLSDNFALNDAK